MVEYNINPQMAYDWIIVLYFFIGGLSVGCFLFSVAANYWFTEFKEMARLTAILAPILFVIALLLVTLDLGKPLRAWRLFLSFRVTSALFWGSWFCVFFLGISTIYAKLIAKDEVAKAKRVAFVGVPFAFLAATYGGILLSQKAGKVLWHTSLLPWMFLVGGLISGLSLIIIIFNKKIDIVRIAKIGTIVGWLLVLELGFIITELILLFTGDAAATHTVNILVTGPFSFLFWFIEILCGTLIPIYFLLKTKPIPQLLPISAILAFVGIFTMRYIVIIGGQVIR